MRPSYRPFDVRVEHVERISPTFHRIVFGGADLGLFGDAMLDQRVKLVLADAGQAAELAGAADWYPDWSAMTGRRPPMRTYTVAAVDRRAGLVALDVACRPVHGPASHFAATCRRGDPALLVGPDGGAPLAATDGIAWRPGPAREFLIVGDETALPAIRNILARLPEGSTGRVVLEVPDVRDATDLPQRPGVAMQILRRDGPVGAAATRGLGLAAPSGGGPTGRGELWAEASPATTGSYSWIAGEARWLRTLRRGLVGDGRLDRARASVMGYWRAGVASAR